ncbi:MAG: glycosyltransferase family 4 protein [Planctomycetota bacterium]|jgi:glycosyltransferase involved in cell wall biosynthesis
MRVLHFAGSYFPEYGGTTTRMYNMLLSGENEHELFVRWPRRASGIESEDIAKDESAGNIQIHRVDYRGSEGVIGKLPFFGHRLYAREFLRRAACVSVDIIHGHNPLACAIASLDYKLGHDIRMVYEAHGIMGAFSNIPNFFGPIKPLNQLVLGMVQRRLSGYERKVIEASDHVIAQTEKSKEKLIELYGIDDKPITVIENGVDASKFEFSGWVSEREKIRAERGWGDKIVFLYAGHLDKVNGIEFLLESLAFLPGQVKERVKIALLGRGPLAKAVEDAAEKYRDLVDFVGLVDYSRIPGYYAACDVFMIPRPPCGPAEAFLPMKLLEAMSMGRIVLVSDVTAMAEVVRDGENGLLFEKGSRDDFVRKLSEIIDKQADLAKLGVRARADVLAGYTWEVSRRKLQGVYESLVR